MSVIGASTYGIAANLRWFALLFVLTSLAASMLVNMALPYVLGYGPARLVIVPAANLGAFALAAVLGATRLIERREHFSKVGVALGYTIVGAAILLAVPAVLITLQFATGALSSPEGSHALVGTAFGVLATILVISPLNFLISWMVLGHAASRETK